MINKVQKKTLVLMAAGFLSLATALQASPVMQGFLIPATPYDGRLNAAGLMSLRVLPNETQNMDALFGKARSFRYAPDAKGHDHWQTPEETEARWSGDCEDKAVWLFAQLKKGGHEGVRLVIGRQNPSSRGLHAWVTLDSADGTFFVLDPTAQKRVWRSTDFSDGSYKPLYSFDGVNRYRHDV